jgi:hypothetical protein
VGTGPARSVRLPRRFTIWYIPVAGQRVTAGTGPEGSGRSFVLDHLGDAHLAADDTASGPQAWRRSFGILNELDHSKAEDVRAKPARLAAR